MVTTTSTSTAAALPHIRIALAGYGAWGRMHAQAIRAISGADVVAVLARSEVARQAAAADIPGVRLYGDYADMLRATDIDVVHVVMPNHTHAQAAIDALQAGKHVVLEKPLGLTLAECDAVQAASERSGRLLAVNHELRVSRQWGPVQQMIARGDFGQLQHLHFSLFRRPFKTGSGGWRYDPDRVGSWVLEERRRQRHAAPGHRLRGWCRQAPGRPVQRRARMDQRRHGRAQPMPERVRAPYRARTGRQRRCLAHLVEWHDGPHADTQLRDEAPAG